MVRNIVKPYDIPTVIYLRRTAEHRLDAETGKQIDICQRIALAYGLAVHKNSVYAEIVSRHILAALNIIRISGIVVFARCCDTVMNEQSFLRIAQSGIDKIGCHAIGGSLAFVELSLVRLHSHTVFEMHTDDVVLMIGLIADPLDMKRLRYRIGYHLRNGARTVVGNTEISQLGCGRTGDHGIRKAAVQRIGIHPARQQLCAEIAPGGDRLVAVVCGNNGRACRSQGDQCHTCGEYPADQLIFILKKKQEGTSVSAQ